MSPSPSNSDKDKAKKALARAEETLREMGVLFRQGLYNGAVDRAYYAAFHAVTAALLSRGLEFARHSAVIAHFGKEFAKTGELDPRYHQTLLEALSLRQKADYDYTIRIDAETAKQVVQGCQELVEGVWAYLKGKGFLD